LLTLHWKDSLYAFDHWKSFDWVFLSLLRCHLIQVISHAWEEINSSLLDFYHRSCRFNVLTIENMLYTLHATYIKHDFYADFLLRLKKLLRENFSRQIHSLRETRSFTAQISIVYFLSMSCRCFICNMHVYHS